MKYVNYFLLGVLGGVASFYLTLHFVEKKKNSSLNYRIAVACGNAYLVGCQEPSSEYNYCVDKATTHAVELFKFLEDAK